ncbi:MAG TPA: hypothetical protein VLY85_00125 [Thermoplasmata archaeon]|nr:hypothetical protein [Thermoplasmata archaeon]
MYASTLEAPVLLIGSAHVVDLDGPMRRLLGERVVDAHEAISASSRDQPTESGARSGSSQRRAATLPTS